MIDVTMLGEDWQESLLGSIILLQIGARPAPTLQCWSIVYEVHIEILLADPPTLKMKPSVIKICLNHNTPPGAKLGLCRSTIYSKFLIGGPFEAKFSGLALEGRQCFFFVF